MKVFKTLRMLIDRLEKKEIKLFIGYAEYKKRKKLIQIFEILLKHRGSDNEELVINHIKRKKLHGNFRHSCNELYQLIIKFWNDQSQRDNKLQDALNLMNAGTILIQKGLYAEGISQMENAKKVALSGNSFSMVFECNMKIAHYSGFYSPGNTLKVLSNYQISQKELLSSISVRSRSYYLSQLTYHFLQEGVWSLSSEHQEMMEAALLETEELLKQPNLNIRSKVVLVSIMGNVLQYSNQYSREKCEHYLTTLVELWKSEKVSENLNNTRNLLAAYKNLAQYYFLLGDAENCKQICTKFKNKFKSLDSKDQSLESTDYYHEIKVYEHLVVGDYTSLAEHVIPEYLEFSNQHAEEMPFGFLFGINLTSFQVYFAVGDYERAGQFEKQFYGNKERPQNTLDNRFIAKICHVLLHFELGDHNYVFNQIENAKRLYSSYLRYNPPAELLLSLLQKLSSKHHTKQEQIEIYKSYQLKLNEVFKVFLNRRIFLFNILEDWLFAKANGYSTINEATSEIPNKMSQ